ncbi:MAG: hypothetical protein VB111_01330 [Clostridiaceae bacterium]|nr:hypothetical protein [Clostridiaceae bacterium]
MDFSEKLAFVIKALEITSAAAGRITGIDASLLSRFRSGERIPARNSVQLDKLCNGFSEYARQNDKENALRALCGCTGSMDLAEGIRTWFLESPLRPERIREMREISQRRASYAFAMAERLNSLMTAVGVSNILLARALKTDASHISRLRSGSRIPVTDSRIIADIADYFAGRALEEDRIAAMFILIGREEGEPEELRDAIYEWLREARPSDERPSLTRFLTAVDSLKDDEEFLSLPRVPRFYADIVSEKIGVGFDGLRAAALDFMNCVLSPDALMGERVIYIYTDHNSEWMREPRFRQEWAARMATALRAGFCFRVVHNIDRSHEELYLSLESWLPFYHYGRIEPYTCQRTGDQRFSHTIFVAPGRAVVNACCVTGTEDRMRSVFTSNGDRVSYYEEQIHGLLDGCSSLMHIYRSEDAPMLAQRILDLEKARGRLTYLSDAPSSSTMPSEMLEEMMLRNGIRSELRQKILADHMQRVERFIRNCAGDGVVEFIGEPLPEFIEKKKLLVNIPPFFGHSIPYTESDYRRHLEYAEKVSRRNPGYRIVRVPHNLFHNIRICSRQGGEVWVLQNDNQLSFYLEHPILCRAYETFLRELEK